MVLRLSEEVSTQKVVLAIVLHLVSSNSLAATKPSGVTVAIGAGLYLVSSSNSLAATKSFGVAVSIGAAGTSHICSNIASTAHISGEAAASKARMTTAETASASTEGCIATTSTVVVASTIGVGGIVPTSGTIATSTSS